jgi:hypothetical protein
MKMIQTENVTSIAICAKIAYINPTNKNTGACR